MKILIPETIQKALAANAPVAIGVSGGKDSCAVALAVDDHLAGYAGPKLLIHSDLGLVEWKDSARKCEQLAERLGWELVVVRRAAGGMIERWEQRWKNNLLRYLNLECVKLILPWSTPAMRFCTSELKSAVIASELKKRFGGSLTPILSVTGIRADESAARAKQPIWKSNPRLERADGTHGYDWHPIHDWSTPQVYEYLQAQEFELHEAYRVFGSSRVSCAFCIMSSGPDLTAAANCPDNVPAYVRMVALEITSTFGFQSSRWLGDVAPALHGRAVELAAAKAKAEKRQAEEARIPKRLEYEKGWPTFIPTLGECALIAEVRRNVGAIMGIAPLYTTAETVQARYAELFAEKRSTPNLALAA